MSHKQTALSTSASGVTTGSVLAQISAARARTGTTPFSAEFMPPRDDIAQQRLWTAAGAFDALGAAFVSVTYGAGGSTRDRTTTIAQGIRTLTQLTPLVHLTLVDHTVAELRQILRTYRDTGLYDVLVLRGDPPGNPLGQWVSTPGGLTYALELIELIRTEAEFASLRLGIASFPEAHIRAADEAADTANTLAKLRAGAEYSITQMFFDVDDYCRLRDRLIAADPEQGAKPIIPGLMPITTLRGVQRQVELSGSTVPAGIAERLTRAAGHDPQANQAAIRAEGLAITTELAQRLIAEEAPCLHFMTLNYAKATKEVLGNLGLIPARAAH